MEAVIIAVVRVAPAAGAALISEDILIMSTDGSVPDGNVDKATGVSLRKEIPSAILIARVSRFRLLRSLARIQDCNGPQKNVPEPLHFDTFSGRKNLSFWDNHPFFFRRVS